jgi:hypothetical protein
LADNAVDEVLPTSLAQERESISVNGISQANGADLLSLYSQSVGQGVADLVSSASAAALNLAIAEVKLNEALLAGGGNDTGNQLNVYA